MGTGLEYISLQSFGLAWMIHMLVGMMWYAPSVFGELCARLSFGNKEPPKPEPQAIVATCLGGAMAVLFFLCVLNVSRCGTAAEGALWGVALGLFLNGGINSPHSFFEERSFGLSLIHRGCHAVSLALVGAVLGQLCGVSAR